MKVKRGEEKKRIRRKKEEERRRRTFKLQETDCGEKIAILFFFFTFSAIGIIFTFLQDKNFLLPFPVKLI